MPLVSARYVLDKAKENGFAVGSFNVANHQFVEGILGAAEELQVPVILSVAEVHFRYLDLTRFISYVHDRIRLSPVPVVLHLDHGTKISTIIKAIHLGFSSVMFDGSSLGYGDNVENTRRVVDIASAAGVSVEAELGSVLGGEGNLSDGTSADPSGFTNPEEAKAFVAETGVDSLAIAIGTVHGPYKGKPQLDVERLREIRRIVDIPLVLHGGSGLSDDDFRTVIASGISKVNFFTENSQTALASVKALLAENTALGFPDITLAAQKSISEKTKHQIAVFGTTRI